ncbi:hypothetical protein [Eikenella corrodens]|uniref:hypothetical protein n=1 Tax=Eikenella corrodens TaxID=539 RepID=UPI0012BC409F|nr:hypothetical protein [Eikenella corrodens]
MQTIRPAWAHPLPTSAGQLNGSSRDGLPEAGQAAHLPKPCPLPSLPPDTSPQVWGFLACQALASPPESPACVFA